MLLPAEEGDDPDERQDPAAAAAAAEPYRGLDAEEAVNKSCAGNVCDGGFENTLENNFLIREWMGDLIKANPEIFHQDTDTEKHKVLKIMLLLHGVELTQVHASCFDFAMKDKEEKRLAKKTFTGYSSCENKKL